MGYQTAYQLEVEPETDKYLIAVIRDSHDYLRMAIDDKGNTEECCKWYKWEEDMRKISSQYPDTLFHLYGEGKSNEDIWVATFKAEKAHIRRAEINIPPFDQKELE